ncbi:MAG: PilN domain-containing protein [Desulfobacteraceae bacterium]|nr:PilN domain-containing protein [Desulfobacteraceae bacterium]
MIRINLLPFRAARKKENVRRQLSIFLLSIVLVSIVVVWVSFSLSNKIKQLDKKISDTKAQVEKYNKINKEIAEIKKKLATLNKKIAVIESLDLNREGPVLTLDNISRLVVEKRMWLTLLEDKGSILKTSGKAVDNQTIADFMTRLNKSKKYKEVKLLSIKHDDSLKEKLNLKKFDITFKHIPPNTNSSDSKAKGK